jgi:phosphoglycolate phosphatase
MREVISRINDAGMAWGVVTNKPRRFSAPLMELMEFVPPCDVLVCPDDVTHRKPHPEPMLLAAEILGCAPAQAVYVGDHLRDIESGQAAGMRTVAAGYGYIEADDDAATWNADFNIDQPIELLNLITRFTEA